MPEYRNFARSIISFICKFKKKNLEKARINLQLLSFFIKLKHLFAALLVNAIIHIKSKAYFEDHTKNKLFLIKGI